MIIKFFLSLRLSESGLRARNWQWNCWLCLLNVLCLSLKAYGTSHPKKDTRNKRQETSLIFFSLFLSRNLVAKICFESEKHSFFHPICLSPANMQKNRTSELTESCQRINDVPGPQTNVLSVYRAIENSRKAGETQKDSKSINLLKKKWTRNCFRL